MAIKIKARTVVKRGEKSPLCDPDLSYDDERDRESKGEGDKWDEKKKTLANTL